MTKPTIAFFGATGGSTISCLAPALEAGYRLARTPSKLHDLLLQRGIPESTITANLTIIQGTATDLEAVKETILPNTNPNTESTPKRGEVADIIISGIGGKLIFESPLHPTLDNPTICQDAIKTILSAIRSRDQDLGDGLKKPLLISLSTTGISDTKRDLPLAMIPMYHWLLKVPHEDKKVMEGAIIENVDVLGGGYVIVRPSLLTGGKAVGVVKVRVGVETDPAVGYTISREDVGPWVFEVLVKKGRENRFVGKIVTITT